MIMVIFSGGGPKPDWRDSWLLCGPEGKYMMSEGKRKGKEERKEERRSKKGCGVLRTQSRDT